LPGAAALGGDVEATALEARLRAALEALALPLAETQVAQLLQYLELLQKWSRVYNLTAVRDPEEMLTQHVFDSLAVVRPLRRQVGDRAASLLDVGSGAGLPGVVLAICWPQLRVDCVDTVAKKAAFIRQVAAALSLPNLRGLHERVERLAGAYDVVACRAFASLPDFVAWSSGVLAERGIWLAMKGKRPDEEMAALPREAEVFHVEQLEVPDLPAQRCIVWMRKRSR
jgi:16S rRNA (guanine527-N7)-methyltransferase